MKCVHCGANIPDGQLICPRCNAEVQMVPDYNPLDDVLAREVKGSVEGATRQIRTDDVRRQRQMSQTQSVRSTRVLNENEMERLREARRENLRRSKEPETGGEATDRKSQKRFTGIPQDSANEAERSRKEKEKESFARSFFNRMSDRCGNLCDLSEFLYRSHEKGNVSTAGG